MVLNQSILATALPTLMHYFNVSAPTAQWLTTAFMLVNGILIPFSAWLSNRINTKWLYLSALFIFEVGNILACLAPSFPILLLARIIQAIGVGIAIPLLQTIMMSILPIEHRGKAMGTAGMIIGFAPAIGPTLSGFVVEFFSWRLLFAILIPITGIVIFLGFWFLKPVLKTSKIKLDIKSLILSSIGFGFLLYTFSSIGIYGWLNLRIIISLVISLTFISIFIYVQINMNNPMLNFNVFKSHRFTLSTIIVSLVYMSMFGVEIIIPMYFQNTRHLTALQSGITLLGGAITMGIITSITGKYFDKHGAHFLAIAGFSLLTISSIPFIFLTLHTSLTYIAILYSLRMFGIAMIMMPITTYGINSLQFNLIGHGTAVINTAKQISGSLATALMISVMSNITNINMQTKKIKILNIHEYKNLYNYSTLKGYSAAFCLSFLFILIGLRFSLKIKSNNR